MTEKQPTPASQMNRWVRDLVKATGLTGPAAASILTKAIGAGYNRQTLYKMTTIRRVTLEEAQALSTALNYPLPDQAISALSYDQRRANLSPKRKAMLDALLLDLESADAREQEAHPVGDGDPGADA